VQNKTTRFTASLQQALNDENQLMLTESAETHIAYVQKNTTVNAVKTIDNKTKRA